MKAVLKSGDDLNKKLQQKSVPVTQGLFQVPLFLLHYNTS